MSFSFYQEYYRKTNGIQQEKRYSIRKQGEILIPPIKQQYQLGFPVSYSSGNLGHCITCSIFSPLQRLLHHPPLYFLANFSAPCVHPDLRKQLLDSCSYNRMAELEDVTILLNFFASELVFSISRARWPVNDLRQELSFNVQ
jgi:hypothetical protein